MLALMCFLCFSIISLKALSREAQEWTLWIAPSVHYMFSKEQMDEWHAEKKKWQCVLCFLFLTACCYGFRAKTAPDGNMFGVGRKMCRSVNNCTRCSCHPSSLRWCVMMNMRSDSRMTSSTSLVWHLPCWWAGYAAVRHHTSHLAWPKPMGRGSPGSPLPPAWTESALISH